MLVTVVSLVVLTAAGYGWSTFRALAGSIVTSDVLSGGEPQTGAPSRTITALVVGVDSRTDAQGRPLPRDVLDKMHAGPDDGQLNTDTIILLRIPADPGKPVVAVSFPRDSYVKLAGDYGTHKINSAYGRAVTDATRTLQDRGLDAETVRRQALEAGRKALVATVTQLTGIVVDHYAEINLAGFVELTDAIGGVPVCLTEPVDDARYSGAVLPAGPQTLDGANALAFVRQRHGLEGGDLDRITRQQAYMAGLANTLLGGGALADPATVQRLLRIIGRYVVLDQGWDLDQLVGQVRRVSASNVEFHTIPTLGSDLSTPYDGVAVQIDADEVRTFVRSTLDGLPVPTTSVAPTTAPTRTAPPTAPPTTGRTSAPVTTGVTTGSATTTEPQPITGATVPCVS
ncbi:LCP family protein [Pseudonocardia sp. N23]|uniref:LCP family protein n=1 Tax=Pseudonocardia sp. N23 TaxID=1987376 RepID=UPI000BFC4474|nr:LCP family protein [Pseudonocardia sp. N23]GAY09533.1 cell envelope-associated transcriptional attenuator LytR-CpsA-Psr, subfamily A1 [Pseudonocardia sp. N23]